MEEKKRKKVDKFKCDGQFDENQRQLCGQPTVST